MPTDLLSYHLCPQCTRAVPASAGEAFCINDGTRLLTACPACTHPITSPYALHCPKCGSAYAASLKGEE